MDYQITFTDIALKNLKKYPKKDQMMLIKNIETLASDPFGKSNIKKLVDFDVSYRLRVGHYRVLFEREDVLRIINIIDVLPRDKVYKR
ncbi:MAG: type II toxin-antitoxin system RelE family toxin [Methylococcales bacterium]